MAFQLVIDFATNLTRNRQNRLCVADPEARAEFKKYGLRSNVVKESGPGGGNPVVKLIGSRPALWRYIHDVYCKDDPESAAEYRAAIAPFPVQ
jgi:hypothetical protein